MKHTLSIDSALVNAALDVLLIPVWEDEGVLIDVPQCIATAFAHAQDIANDESFTGKWQQTLMVRAADEETSVRRVLFYGAGKKQECTVERVRRMIAVGAQLTQRMKLKRYGVVYAGVFAADCATTEDILQAGVESVVLATYAYDQFKTADAVKKTRITHVTHVVSHAPTRSERGALTRGELFAQGTVYARNVINAPANHMTPTVLYSHARSLAADRVAVKGYNRKALEKMGMNTLLAVASGSEQEPYLIHLKYTPKKKAHTRIALCGKGITFDSGGLQVKPGQHMDGMKYDMAAAGVILGMFSVIEQLQPDVEFHGVIAATENMSSGKAMKPGDVVKSYSGKTIEIGHTDAEGRLVLADALAWTEDTIQPDVIIDAATLTGAAIYALGQEYAGIMGNNVELVSSIRASAAAMDENIWELPLVADYEVFLESKIADYTNMPPVNWAGTTLGGLFLQKFVDHTPWAHLDIAGPSWIDRVVKPYNPEGASGYAVRTFLHLLTTLQRKDWKK